MESPNSNRKKTLARKVDQEVEKIIYKVMTNEGLEQTISKAVIKALMTLIRRHFLILAITVLGLLFIQSILISIALKIIIPYPVVIK